MGVIANASFIIFIGFAFRDEYINDLLGRFTSSWARIIVIDPSVESLRLPYAEERVIKIPLPFDDESVRRVLATVKFHQFNTLGA